VAADGAGVYITGSANGALPGQTSAGGAFVRKYDPYGDELWTRQSKVDGQLAGGNGVAVYASGVYITGTTYETWPSTR
jgi:hypothetical protein